MKRMMMLSKIHRARVTQRDLNYVGSITIDGAMLDETGMLENEKVAVYNISNGNRFSTYIIRGEAGSGIIGLNGAAARLVSIEDKVIIINYGLLDDDEARTHKPPIIIVDSNDNRTRYRKKQ
ncbi:MAG: aspartate 1-decarboxylase [Candidatus Cloacimonetes bacterium]|nr:aspartate 1-decarboxylase [Candidatus Cloacimonadota bacterium]